MSEPVFSADGAAAGRLSGLFLGWILFEGAKTEKSSPQADSLMRQCEEKVREKFKTTEQVSSDSAIVAVRRLFSAAGTDPTKDRPSGEALIRRVVSGKGVYRINIVVDTNNCVSMLTGFPCGVYDFEKLQGAITLSIGSAGEKYEGIGGKEVNAENRIITKDALSAFGGPVADSARSSVTLSAKSVLMLVYCHSAAAAQQAIGVATDFMGKTSGAKAVHIGIFELKQN